MQSQLIALLILTSSTQMRGDERPHPEPPRVRHLPAIHVRTNNDIHELTVEMPTQSGEDDDQPAAQPVMRIDLHTAVLERENFDRWLFPDDLTESSRQEHLNAILDAKTRLAARAHKLTDRECAKLRLAGRGDIKRFFDEVQRRRDDFESDRKTFKTGFAALRRLDELSPTYRHGPFGVGSLFAKTLQKINNHQKAGR